MQAGPELVVASLLNRKTTAQAHFRCHHWDLIRDRGRHLISIAVPRMSLYCQRRLVLAADLVHVKLGRDLRQYAVELLHLRKPHQQVLAPLFHLPYLKGVNHLAGLCTIIPEGRSLPLLLDPAVEKRLAQLDVDKEKLLEQITETQRSKRAELRDWDRLDRESSICALKSELAEGHLQRMADESIGGGNLF
ncbi:hypothetical protein N7537_006507 [Penicillium hordei]|uniref:Uncharacterized protein n=1 Tax=Penicillium hordei TaxID=40994 RepID=A0AAD6H229_9EURO|nr:uncharacterized protein N7537_006507 [Penicillium hordei]KAJ5603551.1 hypothetical protein N7537_006507 [Penicillium hordei]